MKKNLFGKLILISLVFPFFLLINQGGQAFADKTIDLPGLLEGINIEKSKEVLDIIKEKIQEKEFTSGEDIEQVVRDIISNSDLDLSLDEENLILDFSEKFKNLDFKNMDVKKYLGYFTKEIEEFLTKQKDEGEDGLQRGASTWLGRIFKWIGDLFRSLIRWIIYKFI